MRNIPEFIMYRGGCVQVKHRCNYDDLPKDWLAHKAMTFDEDYVGKEVICLVRTGFTSGKVGILSVEDYVKYVKSLKVSKDYRRATYKDVEDGKKVCLRDGGNGKPSYEYDHNFVGSPYMGGNSGPKWINISTSPSNTCWATLKDICIKR